MRELVRDVCAEVEGELSGGPLGGVGERMDGWMDGTMLF